MFLSLCWALTGWLSWTPFRLPPIQELNVEPNNQAQAEQSLQSPVEETDRGHGVEPAQPTDDGTALLA
jgi:hypothetical protein